MASKAADSPAAPGRTFARSWGRHWSRLTEGMQTTQGSHPEVWTNLPCTGTLAPTMTLRRARLIHIHRLNIRHAHTSPPLVSKTRKPENCIQVTAQTIKLHKSASQPRNRYAFRPKSSKLLQTQCIVPSTHFRLGNLSDQRGRRCAHKCCDHRKIQTTLGASLGPPQASKN